MSKNKLLLIGWDAADWQVINPLLAEGKMPALQRLINNGVNGNIATLSPALSPMLWTSIATGKRAYDHGIHGFVEVDHVSGNILPVKVTSRKCKAIWNILNEAGLKTNVVNWWPSHPAEKLNGAAVSNHFHKDAPLFGEDWPLEKSAIYPPDFFNALKELRVHPGELTLQHILPFIPQAATLDPEKDKVLKPLMRVLAHCASVHNAGTYLMENSEWDFMAVYYEAIDHFSHLAMKYHPPKLDGVSEEDFKLYSGIVEAAYRYHDMMLERLLDLAGPDCNVMLLSDHGFQSGNQREVELPDVPAAPALEHRKYGVFLASGPNFKTSENIYGASLLDIAPTILHHFDLPVGEDMEGNVIQNLFRRNNKPGFIPSWEMTGLKVEFAEEGQSSGADLLKQLEDLGYIDLSQDNKIAYVEKELNYNLGVSLLDGNKLTEARELLSNCYHKDGELRFGLLLARTLLRTGDSEELKELLAEMKQKFPGQQALLYLEGLQALREGEVNKALSCFQQMVSKGMMSIDLMVEIGRALLISGQLQEAMTYFDNALRLDAENAPALSGKAQCLLELGEAREALLNLEKSLEQQFFQPNAHYLMAQAAHQLGYDEVALKAVQLCLKQAPKHQGARAFLQKVNPLPAQSLAPVIVVSGFPRSGTSMLMQMLQQAGLPIFKDDHRKEDANNPEGYFEHQKVKSLGLENQWLSEANGMVVKIVSPLLRYLPSSESFKVIVVKRPLTEVIVSQEVMKGKAREAVMKNFPFQMAMQMQDEEKRLGNWLNLQPNIDFLEVEYYDCLESPEQVFTQIKDFLGVPMDVEKGKLAINKKLHRNKLGK